VIFFRTQIFCQQYMQSYLFDFIKLVSHNYSDFEIKTKIKNGVE